MKTTLYKTAFFLLLLLSGMNSAGQSKILLTDIDLAKLPGGIKYEGELKAGHRWTDANGDNIVIITETGEYQSTKFKHEEEGTDAELFAYHFIIKDKKALPDWRIYDFISDCPFDLTASFSHDAFRVSDFDNDGYAEVWLLYKTACRSDVSPAQMKVIMYENGKKHAMRGTEKILQGVDEKGNKAYDGGGYEFDPAFTNAPESFRAFAKKLWAGNLYFTP